MFELTTLSKTQIDDYLSCPKFFEYKYIHRIPAEMNFYMRKGVDIHNLFEIFFKKISASEILRASDDGIYKYFVKTATRCYTGAAYKDIASHIKNFATVETMRLVEIKENIIDPREAIKMWLPVECEKFFKLPEIRLRGKIDRIDRTLDGELIVVEYKTGTTPSDGKIPTNTRRQLYYYSKAVEQLYNTEVNHVCVFYSADGGVKYEKIHHRTRSTADDILNFVWNSVSNDLFEPKYSSSCASRVTVTGKYLPECPYFAKCHGLDNTIQ